ncbi:hypothetical protein AB0J48_17840 [Nocardia salmonicida]|uniref:hypothetical protein n=1 Tax=Nocardia salmonicida TaxID=53431 RepID=UPI00343F85A4
MPHSTFRVLLMVAAIGVAAGCSSPQASNSGDSLSSVFPRSTATATTARAAGPVDVTNPKSAQVTMRRGVMATYCDRQFGNDHPAPAAPVIRLPGKLDIAQEVPLPIVSGQQVDAPAADDCATSGTGDDFRIIYAVASHTPSSGLDPEARQLSLFSYRLGEREPASRVTIWKGRERPTNVTVRGSDSGIAVAFDIYGVRESQQVRGYRGVDLTQAWTMPKATVLASTKTTYAVLEPGGCGMCPRSLRVISAVDGSVKYEVPATGDAVGPSLDTVTDQGYGFRRREGMLWFDEASGQPADVSTTVLRQAQGLLPDPTTNLMVVKYLIGSQPMYKVIDRTNWSEILVLDIDRTSGMRIDNVALYDGYLYIQNASDDPVIKVVDGSVAAKGWQVMPVGRIGDTTVLAQAPSALGSSNCVEDTRVRNGTENRAGTPNVYGWSTCRVFTAVRDIDGRFPGPRF